MLNCKLTVLPLTSIQSPFYVSLTLFWKVYIWFYSYLVMDTHHCIKHVKNCEMKLRKYYGKSTMLMLLFVVVVVTVSYFGKERVWQRTVLEFACACVWFLWNINMDYYLVQCNLNTVVCYSTYCFNIKSNFWLVNVGPGYSDTWIFVTNHRIWSICV